MAGVILLLVFIAGYAVQRGSTCAVAAVHALVAERSAARFLSFLLCAAVALAVMSAGALAGRDSFHLYAGADSLILPAAGGALFGLGAWLNGRCAFGTVARLGGGEAARIGTLAGFLAGFGLAGRLGLEGSALTHASPLAELQPAGILGAALAAAALLAWAMRAPNGQPGWSPRRAMLLIGLVNGVLLVLAAGWPYTNLLMDVATATGMDLAWRGAMALVFIAGSVAGAVASGVFRAEAGSPGLWARTFGGGAIMGIGATFVPGGNDTMLLVGLPLLLASFAAAYAAMIAVLALLFLLPRLLAARRSILEDQAVALGVAHAQIHDQ